MKFAVIDFEALNWTELYAVGFYDGSNYDTFYLEDGTNTSLVVEELFNILSKRKLKYTRIYAHNGGKYDFLPILEYCHTRGINYKIGMVIHGRIVRLTVFYNGHKWHFLDSYTLLPDSLARLTSEKGFNVEHKKLSGEDYTTKVRKEYLIHDCFGLYEVIDKFYSEILQFNVKSLPLTISSTASKIYWGNFNKKNKFNLKVINRGDEEIIRNSYFGGRTEVFQLKYTQEYADELGLSFPLRYYDFNSLYPSVMKGYNYPSGKAIKTSKYEPGMLGIYKIRWTASDLWIPLLPHKTKDKKLIFPLGNNIEGWYCSQEIEKALELGYSIDVLEGYYWTEQNRIFDEYVTTFYKIKKESDGSRRAIAKLMLNSLYGKFGQRRDTQEIISEMKLNELIKAKGKNVMNSLEILNDEPPIFLRNIERFNNQKILPFIASFVASYARVKLYNKIEKLENDLFYIDTDSMLTTKKLSTGSELGELKEEHKIQEGYFVLPKLYMYVTTENETIKLAKGMYSKDIPTKAYKEAIENKNMKYFEQKFSRVLGFKECLRRHEHIFTSKEIPKSIIAKYSKRKIEEYNTTPITIYNQ